MQTTQIRPSYQITITDIEPDSDNPSQLEIIFTATLTAGYVRSTGYYSDTITYEPDSIDDYFPDINDYSDDQPYITYELNASERHDSGLYFIIQHEPSGDTIDNRQQAIHQLGQPVIDYVTDACQLLNVPLFIHS